MRRIFFPILLLVLGLVSCKQNIVSDDPSMRLRFSHDSLLFDTVFTDMGSSTRRMMVYNPNANAIHISRITMQDGRHFHVNIDGENRIDRLHDITIRGKDSIFMFVRVNIEEQTENTPVLVEDTVFFLVNEHLQHVALQAYGQNIEIIRDKSSGLVVRENCTLTNKKPYLIYDTLVINGDLTIEPGATLYMHNNALLHVYGSLNANGSLAQPITIRGDRTDRLFDSVPYRVASGQWNGIYLLHDTDHPTPTYTLNYVDIMSGTVGLYVYSEDKEARPNLTFTNGRIHNHSMYGMVLQNTDAYVVNSEISNCASYCVYMSGGTQKFVHSTIASYFGWPYTNINIHNGVRRDSAAAVYINNINKEYAATAASFTSCIIAGGRKNNLRIATPLSRYYEGSFSGNYLQCDSLPSAFAHDNVYGLPTDTVFRNIYYRIGEYRYFDFRLDSVSPARGIGDTLLIHNPNTDTLLIHDRSGTPRKPRPDAGCYEFE